MGLARPHLDSFEHDGPLDAVGTTIRGELAIGRGSSRHNLVFADRRQLTPLLAEWSSVERHRMSIESFVAKRPAIFQSSSRPSSIWFLT
jgi:hypothetical protein